MFDRTGGSVSRCGGRRGPVVGIVGPGCRRFAARISAVRHGVGLTPGASCSTAPSPRPCVPVRRHVSRGVADRRGARRAARRVTRSRSSTGSAGCRSDSAGRRRGVMRGQRVGRASGWGSRSWAEQPGGGGPRPLKSITVRAVAATQRRWRAHECCVRSGVVTYDPRTGTGIPTEPVGSLPRPPKLQEAYARYDAGRDRQGRAGEAAGRRGRTRSRGSRPPARRSSPTASSAGRASPPTRSPTRWPAPGWRRRSARAGSSSRSSPTGTAGSCPSWSAARSATTSTPPTALRKSIPYATKPMKQAVIAPSMLALLYPLKDPVEGYSREDFEAALVDECEKDIREAFAAGAARVSVDFTEGRLATREDPRNPWTGAGLLPHFIELINRVMARFSAEERRNIGVHTCPGGDRDSVHSADVPYNNLLRHDVRHQRRLLPDPAGLRAGQGPGVRVDRPAPAHRRRRRGPDGLHRSVVDPVAAGGDRRRRSPTS